MKTRKVWHTLEATGLLALGSLAGCSADDSSIDDPVADDPVADSRQGAALAGGEGKDPTLTAADDVAYLTQIGLMRGHLWVGNELHKADLAAMAATHMKHPRAELYSTLEAPFKTRGVPGFAAELETLANAVTNSQSDAEVEAAYTQLQSAIRASELGADTSSPGIIGKVIVGLLRTAAEEYAIGIVDGRVNNLHEYQDALGFTRIAAQWARSPAFFGTNPDATAAAANIQAIIDELEDMWPALNPEAAVPQEAARLYGAAARVEIQILGL